MQFSRWYLLALALPSLKDCGTQSVQRCQPDKYYKQLLEPMMGPIGSMKRKHGHGQPALVFQVDAGAIPVEPPQQNTAAAPTVQRRVRGKRPDKNLDVSARALKPLDTPAALKDADPVADPSAGAVPAAPVDAAAARASKQEQQAIKKKQRQDKSHNWGAGYLTFKPSNSWQATCHRKNCHRHVLGKNTRCTRTRSFAKPEHEANCLRQLRYWLNSAHMYDSRVAHMNAKPVPASDLLAPDFDSRLRRDRVADDYDSGADDAAVDAAVPDEGDDRGSQPQQGMIAEESCF